MDQVPSQRMRIGDYLVECGDISRADLSSALNDQRQTGKLLGDVLVDQGYIDGEMLNLALGGYYGVSPTDPRKWDIDPSVASELPEVTARSSKAVVLDNRSGTYHVAVSDPGDLSSVDEIERRLGKSVELYVASKTAIHETIGRLYGREEALEGVVEEISKEIKPPEDGQIDLNNMLSSAGKSSSPAIRLLRTLMEDAVGKEASDIHIEPDRSGLRVRIRKDGTLQTRTHTDSNIASSLVSILKIMAGMNITERRLPQDGRFQSRVRDNQIDIRVSTLPQRHGESVVLRLPNQNNDVATMDKTGMPDQMLSEVRSVMSIPNGLVLVTGPTGSGKSTTLYGGLNEMNTNDVKIITVEDPVEYETDGITQVQVQESIGLDFPRVLRTALR